MDTESASSAECKKERITLSHSTTSNYISAMIRNVCQSGVHIKWSSNHDSLLNTLLDPRVYEEKIPFCTTGCALNLRNLTPLQRQIDAIRRVLAKRVCTVSCTL